MEHPPCTKRDLTLDRHHLLLALSGPLPSLPISPALCSWLLTCVDDINRLSCPVTSHWVQPMGSTKKRLARGRKWTLGKLLAAFTGSITCLDPGLSLSLPGHTEGPICLRRISTLDHSALGLRRPLHLHSPMFMPSINIHPPLCPGLGAQGHFYRDESDKSPAPMELMGFWGLWGEKREQGHR